MTLFSTDARSAQDVMSGGVKHTVAEARLGFLTIVGDTASPRPANDRNVTLLRERHNTDWSDIRDTDRLARPILRATVTKSHVIHVSKAGIRGAVIENAYFQIADVAEPYSLRGKQLRVEVQCLWFGRKPKVTWMHLSLLGPSREIFDYTGQVVRNIGR